MDKKVLFLVNFIIIIFMEVRNHVNYKFILLFVCEMWEFRESLSIGMCVI
jgi:hypothetical protein